MLIKDSLSILGLDKTSATLDQIKIAYRKACKKYHPDLGGSNEMMQAVNEAYSTLKNATPEDMGKAEKTDINADYGSELNEALNAIIHLEGLTIEICGSWIWVGGDTRKHKETLKANGFKWASKKKLWNFRPAGFRSYSRGKSSMDDIRATYGSKRPVKRSRSRIAA